MTIEYEVTVIETGEKKTFSSRIEAEKWICLVRDTFAKWDGKITVAVLKITREIVTIS